MTHTLDMLSSYFHRRQGQTPTVWTLPLCTLPGLVALWVPAYSDTTACYDVSQHGVTLTAAGSPTVSVATAAPGMLVPYWVFGGTNEYFTRNDEIALSLTGDITICGWVRWDDFDVEMGIVNKWETSGGNNRSYALYSDTSNQLNMAISEDGGAVNMATGTYGTALSAATWYFVQGRFSVSTDVRARVDDGSWGTTACLGISAVYDNARPFRIGEYNETASKRLDGRWAWLALCAHDAPTAVLDYIYTEQAPLFGKS